MAKRKIELTSDQKRKNEAILARLEAERIALIEETRSLQDNAKRRAGRKKKNDLYPN
jgi:hypothetical protein